MHRCRSRHHPDGRHAFVLAALKLRDLYKKLLDDTSHSRFDLREDYTSNDASLLSVDYLRDAKSVFTSFRTLEATDLRFARD